MIGRLFKSIIGRNAPLANKIMPKGLIRILPPTALHQSRTFMLRITPAFEFQRRSPQSRAFSTNAYERFGSSEHWVPSEKLIDDHIAQLLARFNLASQIAIHRYQGQAQPYLADITPLSQHRDQHYCQVHRLPLFRTYHSLPDMENGVDIQHDPDLVNRCLVLTHKNTQIILGAVYFTIDLHSRHCHLQLIQIDRQLQKKNLGKLLMHCAVNVALLYYCSMIRLTSTDNAVPFYEQMGFQPRADGTRNQYALDFIRWPNDIRLRYLASLNSVLPNSHIMDLIEEVRSLYPTPTAPSVQAIQYFSHQSNIDECLRTRFRN